MAKKVIKAISELPPITNTENCPIKKAVPAYDCINCPMDGTCWGDLEGEEKIKLNHMARHFNGVLQNIYTIIGYISRELDRYKEEVRRSS